MRAVSNQRQLARRLRKKMSLPEVLLWRELRGRAPGKPVFRRQHPLGPYVLDFYCAPARLCVEVDGAGHGFGERPQADARRDAYMRHLGVRTVRLSASEVIAEPHVIAQNLLSLACELSTTAQAPPPPLRGPPPP